MHLFKFLIGTTAVVATACAVAGKVHKDKEKQEELDEFLCPGVDAPIEKEIAKDPNPLQAMVLDIKGFKDATSDVLPVTISYAFENSEDAKKFQKEIAENGLTSTYDDETKIVDVIYHDGVNESDVDILADTLLNACKDVHAKYEGFHFNK